MIAYRPIGEEDLPFLRELYASTRADEMVVVPWDEAQKRAFLEMQFEAQHTYYLEQFADASFDLILQDGEPIGRLYIDRRDDEHRLIDIALLPAARGRGIGGSIMRRLLDEAAAESKPVRIHVEQHNTAMRLYERLGFERIEEQGVYWFMEWQPPQPAAAAQGGAR